MNRASSRPLRSFAAATALLATCVIGDAALAARSFPPNSRQVKLDRVADDAIVADRRPLHLAPGVLVYSTNNTTLVRGVLQAGMIVRVQVDLNGDVRRIWLLNDDEILERPWWRFWNRDQPQTPPQTEQTQ